MARFFGMSTVGVAIALGFYFLTGESASQRLMRTRALLLSPLQLAQLDAPTTAPVVITEDTPSYPPAGSGCATARYTVRLHNVNDVASVFVNQTLVARTRWGYQGTQPLGEWRRIGLHPGDSGWVELTPHLKPGKNILSFQLWEKYGLGRSSVSIVLKRDDTVVFTEAVETRSGHQGLVYDKTISLMLSDCASASLPG
jgi:hypothetical protein